MSAVKVARLEFRGGTGPLRPDRRSHEAMNISPRRTKYITIPLRVNCLHLLTTTLHSIWLFIILRPLATFQKRGSPLPRADDQFCFIDGILLVALGIKLRGLERSLRRRLLLEALGNLVESRLVRDYYAGLP